MTSGLGVVEGQAPAELLERLARGGDLLRQGELGPARAEVAEALALAPRDPRARNLHGLVSFHEGRFDDALAVYLDLVAEAPADPSLRLNLGMVHLKLGALDRAIIELGQVLEMRPGHKRALGYLGLAYARRGEFQLARDAFFGAAQPELARQMDEYATADVEPASGASDGALDQLDARAASALSFAGPLPSAPAGRSLEAEESAAAHLPASEAPAAPEQEVALAQVDEAPAGVAPAPIEAGASQPVDVTEEMLIEEQSAVGLGDAAAGASAPEPAATDEPRRRAASVRRVAEHARRRLEDEAPFGPADGGAGGGGVTEPWVVRSPGDRPPMAPAPAMAPSPLRELVAARLMRTDEEGLPFEVGFGGALAVRVRGRLFVRTDGAIASSGELAYEPAPKRVRGRTVDQVFGGADQPLFAVRGRGGLVLAARGAPYRVVALQDDIFYVREELVWGFEEGLHWENGRVPGAAGALPVVQFRGEGLVALRLPASALCVKLPMGEVMFVEQPALLGWVGRVVPRALPAASPSDGEPAPPAFVECVGEGVLLLDQPPSLEGTAPPAPVPALG